MSNDKSNGWDFTNPENIQIRTTLKVCVGAALGCFFLYQLHSSLVSAIDRNGQGRWDQLDEFHGDQVRRENHPDYPALELEQIKKIAEMNEEN